MSTENNNTPPTNQLAGFVTLLADLRTVMHDIKNGVFVMETNMKMMESALHKNDNSTALACVAKAFEQLNRIKTASQSKHEEKVPVGSCKITSDVAEEFKIKDLKITFDYQQGEKYIFIRYTDIYRIIQNIVKNAIEAMDQQCDKRLHLSVKDKVGNSEMVSISLWNAGPHIPFKEVNGDRTVSYIFDRGFTTKETGDGIGLDMVKRIVQAHGGHCIVKNVGTGGVEFSVVFPKYKGMPLKDLPEGGKEEKK